MMRLVRTLKPENTPPPAAGRLAMMGLPYPSLPAPETADDLLKALVAESDTRGRYFGEPNLVRRLFWAHDVSRAQISRLMVELCEQGDIDVRFDGPSSYSEDPVAVLYVLHRQRFQRFKPRPPIPVDLRLAVYTRDGFACVSCATVENLSLDHVHPYSLGGEDLIENLQTMCRSCNSRKGARV